MRSLAFFVAMKKVDGTLIPLENVLTSVYNTNKLITKKVPCTLFITGEGLALLENIADYRAIGDVYECRRKQKNGVPASRRSAGLCSAWETAADCWRQADPLEPFCIPDGYGWADVAVSHADTKALPDP